MSLNSKAVAINIAPMGMDFEGNNNCYITGWGLTQGKSSLAYPSTFSNLKNSITIVRDNFRLLFNSY